MDTTNITTQEDLELRVGKIIADARKLVYSIVEDIMWETLSEAGHCILKHGSLSMLTRRSISGISTNTLQNICSIIEGSGDFSEVDEQHKKMYLLEFLKARSLSFDVTRIRYPNYLKPWSDSDNMILEQLWCDGMSIKDLASHFGRNPGAIEARIEKLKLIEKYGKKPKAYV